MTYWNKYLAMSKVLTRCPETRRVAFQDHQGTTRFVYGGDAFDKGGDDLVFAEELIQLKEAYPGRVTLIGGNRDFNKMNLASYFTDEAIQALDPDPRAIPIPYFMAHDKNAVPYATFLSDFAPRYPTDRPTKLSYFRWRLEYTMGCKGLFEMRRQYVASVKKCLASDVSDEDVMESFLSSANGPSGVVYRYLEHLQIAEIIEGTLFVHGAVNKVNAGFVPSKALREHIPSGDIEGNNVLASGGSVQEWVAALNKFAADGIKDWKASPALDPTTGQRGGSYLGAYCHSKATRGKTVVIPSFSGLQSSGAPVGYVDLGVVEHLNTSGVFRICSGHKPMGDVAVTIQQPGLSIHIADNSYCGKGLDLRGEAVQEVLLDGVEGKARCHGRRADGSPFDFDMDHPLVGMPVPLPDAASEKTVTWWSSAVLNNDERVLLHRTENDYFTVQYETVDASVVQRQAEASPLTNVGEGEFSERYRKEDLKPMKRKVVVQPS